MKNKKISARITDEAYIRLQEISTQTNLSKSKIIEYLISNKKIVVISCFYEFISALKLAERNLNQVAARLSMGHNLHIDINQIRNIYNNILELLKQIKRGEF